MLRRAINRPLTEGLFLTLGDRARTLYACRVCGHERTGPAHAYPTGCPICSGWSWAATGTSLRSPRFSRTRRREETTVERHRHTMNGWRLAFGASLITAPTCFGLALALDGANGWVGPLCIGLAATLPGIWILMAAGFAITTDGNASTGRELAPSVVVVPPTLAAARRRSAPTERDVRRAA